MEEYIKYGLGPKLKKCIAQIRVSGYDLEIERGRKSPPKPTPAEERYCRHCPIKVEDENNFITVCPLYRELKTQKHSSWRYTFSFLDWFRSDDHELHYKLAIFIQRAIEVRKHTSYNYFQERVLIHTRVRSCIIMIIIELYDCVYAPIWQ